MEDTIEKHTQTEKTFKETFKAGSPQEVHDKAKDVVQKGVAAVAGALEGFNERARSHAVPDAIHGAGDAARSTISDVADEARHLKEPLREASAKVKETARELGEAFRDTARQTREGLAREPGAGGATLGVPDIRDTRLAKTDRELSSERTDEEQL